jgi:hypothetical protein
VDFSAAALGSSIISVATPSVGVMFDVFCGFEVVGVCLSFLTGRILTLVLTRYSAPLD